MKKLVTYLLGISLTAGVFAQQRPVTSTYMFNGQAINPAYVGSLNVFSAMFIHRKQWINVEGAPTSNIFSMNTSLLKNQIGVGFQVVRDKIGIHEETAVYGSYAYKIRTSAGILSLGLSGGFDNRRSDFNELSILNTEDPLLTGTSSRFNPNFGTGIYFANSKMYLGVSVPYIIENSLYLIENTTAEAKESRYYYGTGGVIFDINPNVKFAPSALIRYQEQNRLGWDLNATIIFDEVAYAGISYRNGDALVFLTQLILNDNFRVGYAYDATTSALTNESRGTHEILLNYRIKLRIFGKPDCPVYF